MYFYRKKGDLSSQEENGRLVTGATCRSRFDESRRCGRQQSLCFSPGQINSRWPPPLPPPPLRVGLNSSGNGEASASRFSVSIALRQMEMASFHHHFRISVSALSLFRGPHTYFVGGPRNCAPRNRFIPLKTPRFSSHRSNPSSSAFLLDRRKSCRPISCRIERDKLGRRGIKCEGKVFWKLVFECGIRGLFWIWEEVSRGEREISLLVPF